MQLLGFLGGLTALGFISWSLFGVLFASGRRRRRLKMAGLGVVALMVSFGVLIGGSEQVARDAGFESGADRASAEKAGVTDPLVWQARKQEAKQLAGAEVAKRQQEKAAIQQAEGAKKKEDEDRAEAERLLAEKAKQEECRKELKCWAESVSIEASVDCSIAITKLAKWDYEWTDGIMEPKFAKFRWRDEQNGIVTFIGDKLKMQNGFGAWKPMSYTCDYDPVSKTVLASQAY